MSASVNADGGGGGGMAPQMTWSASGTANVGEGWNVTTTVNGGATGIGGGQVSVSHPVGAAGSSSTPMPSGTFVPFRGQ